MKNTIQELLEKGEYEILLVLIICKKYNFKSKDEIVLLGEQVAPLSLEMKDKKTYDLKKSYVWSFIEKVAAGLTAKIIWAVASSFFGFLQFQTEQNGKVSAEELINEFDINDEEVNQMLNLFNNSETIKIFNL